MMKRPTTYRVALALSAVLAAGIVTAAICVADDAPADQEWNAPSRAAKKKNPIPADAASIAAGKTLYVGNCLSCHGPTGKGDGPAAKDLSHKPHNLTDPKISSQSDGALFWKITQGKKPMPTFEKLLGDDDRWNVVNYLRVLAPPAAGDSNSQSTTQP